ASNGLQPVGLGGTLNSSARARMPSPVEGIDMRALAIGPREAFVLSRVDGRSSEVEIAQATGLDLDDVIASLTRLHQLGAIAYAGEQPPAAEHSAVVPSGSGS